MRARSCSRHALHQQVRISNELAAEPHREAGSAHNRKEPMTHSTMPDRRPPGLAPLDYDVDHVRGPAVGRLILEYGDYECPYSRQAYREIERVEEELGGGIRFAFRYFPLTEIHPHAFAAAAAAEAAAGQGRFGSGAATAPRTGMPRPTPAPRSIRSPAPPSRERTGAGATWTGSRSWSPGGDRDTARAVLSSTMTEYLGSRSWQTPLGSSRPFSRHRDRPPSRR